MSDDTSNKSVVLTFRVPPEYAARLKREAERQGISKTDLILKALSRLLRVAV